MPRAAIDVGSNTLILLVVDDQGRTIHDEAIVVGLGKGLGDGGAFQPERKAKALEVFVRFAHTAGHLGVPADAIVAAATSGARRAADAPAFFAHVADQTGIHVRTISGDDEADTTWRGATGDLVGDGVRLVIDLGGGSTELVIGRGPVLLHGRSLEIGSVRLTERFLGVGPHDPQGFPAMVDHIDALVAGYSFEPRPGEAVAVAGTATTLGAMDLGLVAWDRDRVHHHRLSRTALQGFARRFLAASPEGRRALCAVSPERADWLCAGATVLDRVLAAAGLEALVVSDRGLRHGLLTPR